MQKSFESAPDSFWTIYLFSSILGNFFIFKTAGTRNAAHLVRLCSCECDKISSLPVFFMWTKNLHIESFTLITSCLFFYVTVKIYTSSLLHCYQLPIFFNESTYLLIKFLALISSFLYLYEMQFFPCLHNFFEGIKNICQVYSFINQEGLVMTRLKELGRSGNYVL